MDSDEPERRYPGLVRPGHGVSLFVCLFLPHRLLSFATYVVSALLQKVSLWLAPTTTTRLPKAPHHLLSSVLFFLFATRLIGRYRSSALPIDWRGNPDRKEFLIQVSNQTPNGFKLNSQSHKDPYTYASGNSRDCGMTAKDIDSIRVQTVPQGFKKLQEFAHGNSVQKQASNALRHVQSWNKLQAQIRSRRAKMAVEGLIRQKKRDNHLHVESKLHELEVEWNGGTETKEEIIARIYQREEAAVRRERAMAYAFSHQWRPNSGMNQGPFLSVLVTDNWEWSWVDKWIAAKPWEPRSITLTKAADKACKNAKLPSPPEPDSAKPGSIDGKDSMDKPPKQADQEMAVKESNEKLASSETKQEQVPARRNKISFMICFR